MWEKRHNRVDELVTECLSENGINKTEVLETILLFLLNNNGQVIG